MTDSEGHEYCQRCGAPWPWAGPAQSANSAGDVTIFAAMVVLSIILIVAYSATTIISYLRTVINAAGRMDPPPGHAARRGVRHPRTGGPPTQSLRV